MIPGLPPAGRIRQIVFDAENLGRQDGESGSWDPRDTELFNALLPQRRKALRERIAKLYREAFQAGRDWQKEHPRD